jgi:glucose 1-dehydrogenase
MTGLMNKRVLITGATQGIGLATARRFASEGAKVVITDVVADETLLRVRQEFQKEYPGRVIVEHLDVTHESEVRDVFGRTEDLLGGLDVLINNAGINRQSPTHEFTLKDFDEVVDVNLRGAFLCSRAALNIFLRQGSGLVLMNSSNHEIVPKPNFVAYSVSKGGLGNLMRTIALEYADRGIRANSVAPGATITPINASWKDDATKRSMVEKHIPMGRSAESEEIAAAFAFLASDDANYITGQTLYVDGGLTLHTDFRKNWAS